MKKSISVILILVLFLSTGAFALRKNQSLEYGRTLHRDASTEVDAAFHNPAGIMFMDTTGFHLELANQTIMQNRYAESDEFTKYLPGDDKYIGEIRAWYFPTINASYHNKKWGGFFHFGPIGDGAGGEWGNGAPFFESIMTKVADAFAPYGVQSYNRDISLEGMSVTFGGTLGGAYKINDMLSVALGYRLNYHTESYQGTLNNIKFYADPAGTTEITNALATAGAWIPTSSIELDYKKVGLGHSIILGFDVKPTKKMNIGFKWDYTFKFKNNTDSKKAYATGTLALNSELVGNLAPYQDGYKSYGQEAMHTALGVSYMVLPKLKLEWGLIWEAEPWNDRDGDEEDYHHKIYTGPYGEYAFTKKFRMSLGYAFENAAYDKKHIDFLKFSNNAQHIALGGDVQVNRLLSFGFGFMYTFATENKGNSGIYKKDVAFGYDYAIDISYGLSLHF